ncbi:MAG: hypothetical protein ABIP33_11270, partial [Pseudolysinimonas sp.]
ELLSGSLKRAAQPGDSAGVADTIRARVAAGDTGTPAPNGSAPGFGSGLGSWLPWVGAIVVLGLVGGVLGVTGVFGHPTASVTVAHPGSIVVQTVGATSCPGGPVVTDIPRGSHVLALARSADNAAVQVRNPANTPQLVWIGVGTLKPNSGQPAVSTLPVGNGCPVLTVIQPAPVVVTPTPTPTPKPKDTTPPSVGAITVNNTDNCKPVVTAQITDNVGVVSATLTGTSGAPWNFNQTVVMTHSGGSAWTATLNMPSGFLGIVNLSVTGRDAAGNATTGVSKFTDTPGCPIG